MKFCIGGLHLLWISFSLISTHHQRDLERTHILIQWHLRSWPSQCLPCISLESDGNSSCYHPRTQTCGDMQRQHCVVPMPPSWRQPLRVDGLKASQRSIITYEIHFCTDQVKTHREVRFWFDVSYDATKVHWQMLRMKFCYFLFVFCGKVLPWDLVYKMAGPKTRDT